MKIEHICSISLLLYKTESIYCELIICLSASTDVGALSSDSLSSHSTSTNIAPGTLSFPGVRSQN